MQKALISRKGVFLFINRLVLTLPMTGLCHHLFDRSKYSSNKRCCESEKVKKEASFRRTNLQTPQHLIAQSNENFLCR